MLDICIIMIVFNICILSYIVGRDIKRISEDLKEEKKRIDYLYKEVHKIKE